MVAFKNAFLVAALVAASSTNALVLRAAAPACVTSCETTAANAVTGCKGISDLDCVCNSPTFFGTYGGCVATTCDASDVNDAITAATQLCTGHTNQSLVNSLTADLPTSSIPTGTAPVTPTATDSSASTTPTTTDSLALVSVTTTNTVTTTSASKITPPATSPPASGSPSNSAPPASTTSSKSGAVAQFGNGVFGSVAAAVVAGVFALF